jgi:hypothetical protein
VGPVVRPDTVGHGRVARAAGMAVRDRLAPAASAVPALAATDPA